MPLKSSISSHVRISYRFYEFVTTRYTTDFYIITKIILVLGFWPLKSEIARFPIEFRSKFFT